MYAVIKSGGKQYRVSEGDRISIDLIAGDVGADWSEDNVLLIGGDGEAKVGTPQVDGAKVTGKIIAHTKGNKIRVFKRAKRKGFHKTIGHRQQYTEVEITGIAG